MTAVIVIAEAARLSVELRAAGDRIVARPRAALTPELAEAIRQCRAEILALLAAAVPPPLGPCWSCRSHRYFARLERLTWICARCHPPVAPTEMVWHEVAAAVAP
jgi:hypothetical protein